ncbi:MAG: hypothetical protein GQ542_20300 [Desulforhopalus sp.]|nr:hypothetical protein [Desulforhopalus sp.]
MNSFSQENKSVSFSSDAYYKICVLGDIDASWSDRLGGMSIESALSADKKHITFLEGRVTDQAELIGIVNSLYQMRLPLLSVSLVEYS